MRVPRISWANVRQSLVIAAAVAAPGVRAGSVPVAVSGDAAPGGGSFTTGLFGTNVAAGNKVSFATSLANVGGPTGGLFSGDGASPLVAIAHTGDAAPGGVGTFTSIGSPASSSAGALTSQANFNDGFTTGTGIYTFTPVLGSVTLTERARLGAAAPGGGTFSSFGLNGPVVSIPSGLAAFNATLTSGS